MRPPHAYGQLMRPVPSDSESTRLPRPHVHGQIITFPYLTHKSTQAFERQANQPFICDSGPTYFVDIDNEPAMPHENALHEPPGSSVERISLRCLRLLQHSGYFDREILYCLACQGIDRCMSNNKTYLFHHTRSSFIPAMVSSSASLFSPK